MSLDPPLDTRPLVAEFERKAVRDWLARIDPEKLEEAMILHNDLGAGIAETALGILKAWADVGQ